MNAARKSTKTTTAPRSQRKAAEEAKRTGEYTYCQECLSLTEGPVMTCPVCKGGKILYVEADRNAFPGSTWHPEYAKHVKGINGATAPQEPDDEPVTTDWPTTEDDDEDRE